MLELKREPEVVFWVFVFPLLLARDSGLPSATSRSMRLRLRLLRVAGAQASRGAVAALSAACIIQDRCAERRRCAQKGFRLGKYDLVIEPDGAGGLRYRYDPARPESVLARAQVDDALQTAAGRKDVVVDHRA